VARLSDAPRSMQTDFQVVIGSQMISLSNRSATTDSGSRAECPDKSPPLILRIQFETVQNATAVRGKADDLPLCVDRAGDEQIERRVIR